MPSVNPGPAVQQTINSQYATPQLIGIVDGSNAAAGFVGEYIESVVLTGNALALSTGVALNVTSIVLTPGDWDVNGSVSFNIAATTTIAQLAGGSSTTTAAFQTGAFFNLVYPPSSVMGVQGAITSMITFRYNIVATTTIFLVAQSTFGTSTNAAYGTIRARRIR